MKGVDFVFLDAPLSAAGAFRSGEPPEEAAVIAGSGPRGWWNAAENTEHTFVRPAESRKCKGWEESLEYVKHFMKEQGPFHGVLAFSQGCAVAAALLQEASVMGGPLATATFAILIGGFIPKDQAVEDAMRAGGRRLRVQSLHVSGSSDELVCTSRSKEFATLFEESDSAWFEHEGRHVIPTGSGPFKVALQELLARSCPPIICDSKKGKGART